MVQSFNVFKDREVVAATSAHIKYKSVQKNDQKVLLLIRKPKKFFFFCRKKGKERKKNKKKTTKMKVDTEDHTILECGTSAFWVNIKISAQAVDNTNSARPSVGSTLFGKNEMLLELRLGNPD